MEDRLPSVGWPGVTKTLRQVTCSSSSLCPGGGTPACLEIDKLLEGLYRATVGTLFEYQELCRTGDLEGLLRHARAVAVSRSFDDMVGAIRAMRTLDDSVH
jgi:hypothetical protein